jgi:hypothetical protein
VLGCLFAPSYWVTVDAAAADLEAEQVMDGANGEGVSGMKIDELLKRVYASRTSKSLLATLYQHSLMFTTLNVSSDHQMNCHADHWLV